MSKRIDVLTTSVIENPPEMSIEDARKYQQEARQKLVDGCCKNGQQYMDLLSSVLRWGVKHEYITRNPAEGLHQVCCLRVSAFL